VTVDNLRGAIHRVLAIADDIGPMLTTVYGGATPIPLQPTVTEAG